MISLPPKIDLLPEHLIDQIKAGEVIERPGSLIKEILENSVDAGSKRIELTLKNNGLDLIALKDNGHGMSYNDLPLAFHRHATSKISRFEDLYKLNSFGFRGEALASIASISKVQCSSFILGEKEGSEIRYEGGQTIYHGKKMKSGVDHGTELIVQDLFYNTPARLKFIQAQSAEKQFIKKIFYSFVLSHPEIEFQIKYDEDEKEIIPVHENLKERILYLAPRAKDQIFYSERFYENNELTVYLIPASVKTPVRLQNIYINDRYVLDKQLHKVMSNSLQMSFPNEDYHYIAFFHLPVDTIDVNVHPNKTLIKCMSVSKMISLITSTIKEMANFQRPASSVPTSGPVPSFLSELDNNSVPGLLQERHSYNMEGHFSPHLLHLEKNENFIWVGKMFLKFQEFSWIAVHAGNLLNKYVELKLSHDSSVIPLLVSEPYQAKGIDKNQIELLLARGFELDFLNAETIVLRGIPEWMNGFPLQSIVENLLHKKSLSTIEILPSDWSQSSWEEMLNSFSENDRRTFKIAFPLDQVLQDKFK